MDVVVGGEDGGGHFSRGKKMAEISARVAAADAARTIRINGPLVFCVARVLDEHAALAGVEAGVARGARRQDTIHHVNTERDVVGDLFGAADAHEIARAIFGKKRRDFGGHGAGDLVRLANSKAADGVTWKIELEKLAGALAAQIRKSGALYDAELPLLRRLAIFLSGFLKTFAGAASPSRGALQRGFSLVARRGSFNAFVENHCDVGTEGQLNLGGFFGCEQMFGAVEMRSEAHAFIGNFAKFGKAEDLIATGIGQDGAGLGHELMQAAEAANQLMARTQIKMIGVGEDDFRAKFFERFLRKRLYGSLRANRQKKRCLHHAMRRGQAAAARAGWFGLQDFKRKRHPLSVSGEDEGPANAKYDPDGPYGESHGEGLSALQLSGIYRRKTNCYQD